MVIRDVSSEIDNKRFLKGVQQSQQGQWTNWEETLQKSITWNDIWRMAPLRLSFLIRSTYDQLSSKNNLFKWKKESDPICPLCNDEQQTLKHMLNSCKTTLGNEKYTWRHNRILDELVRFSNRPEDRDSIPGRVIPKTKKMVIEVTLLNTQHYKVSIKRKVEQSREWSTALPNVSVLSLLKRSPSTKFTNFTYFLYEIWTNYFDPEICFIEGHNIRRFYRNNQASSYTWSKASWIKWRLGGICRFTSMT